MKKLMQTFVGVVLVALIIALLSLRAEASPSTVPECSLKGEGIVTDARVKHRIFIEEEPVFGANDMDSVSTHLKELRHAGICR